MSANAFRLIAKQMIAAELSPAARSAKLAEFARQGVAGLVASGRASPTYCRFVDGAEGAQESAVRPNGLIEYQFSYIADVVLFALVFLRARSPVGPGAPKSREAPGPFRDAFMVGVDGRPVPAASFQPRSVPLNAEIIIYNRQPYSRKIDVQLVGRKSLHFSVPPGLFDDCVRAVRRRYGNTVTAKRVYNIEHPGKWMRRRGKLKGQKIQSPAIIIAQRG